MTRRDETDRGVVSPYLTTAETAVYLKFRSASGVRSAVSRGELRPAGVGAKNTLLFTIDELERFISERARRYGVASHGTSGTEKERPDETIRHTDEVSRRVHDRKAGVPRARHVDRSAHRQAKGGGSTDPRSVRETSRKNSRRDSRQGEDGRGADDQAEKGWGIRAIVDEVEGAKAGSRNR